jgi:delta24(24(1))-sterol reductase
MATDTPVAALRKRGNGKTNHSDVADGVTDASKIASGASRAVMKPNAVPTEHGQEMDKLLDTHTEYEFAGPLGTGAMMLGFPPLMCELPPPWQIHIGETEGTLLMDRLLPHLLVVL